MVTYVAAPFQIKELTNSYLAVGILAIFMVKFRKYDVQTNEFAVAQRQKREKAASEGENPENLEN
jgi:hypothetical protein